MYVKDWIHIQYKRFDSFSVNILIKTVRYKVDDWKFIILLLRLYIVFGQNLILLKGIQIPY